MSVMTIRHARWSVRLLLAATAAGVFALAGCGGGGNATSPSGNDGAPVTGAAPAQLRIAWAEPVATLNLNRTTDALPQIVWHLIGGTLVDLDKKGSGTVPGLAKAVEPGSDGLSYTIDLRPGLKFSDGSPLTSKDVKATFEAKMADQSNPNASDVAAWRSISTPSESKVVIRLKAPQPSLPVLLAAPWNAILPASGLKEPASTFYRQPVSAGPYKVESMASDGSKVTLAVNPNYAGAKPVVPRVVFTDVEDENTRRIQLQGNQIDVAGELDPTALKQLKSDGVTVTANRQFGAYYIWMSNRKPPLSDENVRKAISDAVDRQQMNTVVWAGQNRPLGGLLPSTMPGHEDNISTQHDTQKAKQLLAGTPCASGCRIGIMVRNGRPVDQKSALVLKQDLQQIGIDVEIEQVDNGVASKREADGNFDMEIEWLGLPLPVPDTFLTYAVVSDGGIDALFSGYHSAEMDAAAKQVMTTSGPARDAAMRKVNAIFARDLPYVPLFDYAQVLGWRTAAQPYLKFTPSGYFEVAAR